MHFPNNNYPAQTFTQNPSYTAARVAGRTLSNQLPFTAPPNHLGMVYPPPQANWSYKAMQLGNQGCGVDQDFSLTMRAHLKLRGNKIPRTQPQPIGKRKREMNPLRTEHAKRIKAEGHLFHCETCEQNLVLVDFGNRTQEKLLRGMTKGLSCRACHQKKNLPNKNSQRKSRILNAHLRKPKPLEVVLIFAAEHANAIMELKKKELRRFGLNYGVRFKMDEYTEGALERIGRVKGLPDKVSEAIKELSRMKTEIKGGRLHWMDFCIEQTNLGGIVGRGGSQINKIREESKAEVKIKGSPRLPNSSCVRMKIVGTEQNFGKAVSMAMERFHKNRVPIKMPYIPQAPVVPASEAHIKLENRF